MARSATIFFSLVSLGHILTLPPRRVGEILRGRGGVMNTQLPSLSLSLSLSLFLE